MSTNLSDAQLVPPEMIDKVLTVLESSHVLNPLRTAPTSVLGVPSKETRVTDVVLALRQYQVVDSRQIELTADPIMETLVIEIEKAVENTLGGVILKILASNSQAIPSKQTVSQIEAKATAV